MDNLYDIYDKYFGCKYDINGDIYELTAIYPEINKLILLSVNDDTYITYKIDDFDFDKPILYRSNINDMY